MVFDRSGRIVSVAQKEHEQIYPEAGWVEHDANEIWRRTREVIGEALDQRALRPGAVAEMARDGGQDRFRAQTGLPLATYFSALKIQWILDHVPGVRDRAEAGDVLFGNIDTFLVWNLTGGLHITDCTNASRTMLMNLATLDWDQELLDAFRIPRAMLPRIV